MHIHVCVIPYTIQPSEKVITCSEQALIVCFFLPPPQWIFQSWPSVRRDLRTPCLWFIRGYNTMTRMDADKGDVTWKSSICIEKSRKKLWKPQWNAVPCCAFWIENTEVVGLGGGKGLGFCLLEMVIVFDWLCTQNIKRQNIWYTAIVQQQWTEAVSASEVPSYWESVVKYNL